MSIKNQKDCHVCNSVLPVGSLRCQQCLSDGYIRAETELLALRLAPVPAHLMLRTEAAWIGALAYLSATVLGMALGLCIAGLLRRAGVF